MPKIIWDQSFSVGNHDLDAQHQQWIDIINRLHESLMSDTFNPESSHNALQDMLAYALTHFSTEEKFMQAINFPGLSSHQRVHTTFQKKVETILADMRSGSIVLNRDIMDMLTDWLTRHILDMDKQYASFHKGDTV